MTCYEKILQYCEQIGETIERVSERSGVSLKTMQDMKNNLTNAQLLDLIQIADALNVPVDWLTT